MNYEIQAGYQELNGRVVNCIDEEYKFQIAGWLK